MSKPLITIITATFNLIAGNRKEYFRQCVESVHNQTYDNIEHIIVDGGSNDGTIELIGEYVDKGWVKLHIEKDEGIYDAFNHGTMIANGDYIAFLNSDDYYINNDGIKTAVQKLISSGADYSYSHILSLDNNSIVKADIHKVFSGIPYYQLSMLVKKEILMQNPFDLTFPIAADYDLFIKLILKKYKSVFVNCCYAAYRPGGVSDNAQAVANDIIKLYSKYYDNICELQKNEYLDIWNNDCIPVGLFLKLCKKTGLLFSLKMASYYIKKHFRKWMLQIRTKKNHRILRIFGIEIINEEKTNQYKKIFIVSSRHQFTSIKNNIMQNKKHYGRDFKFYHRKKILPLSMDKFDIIIADKDFKYKEKYAQKYIELNEKTLPFYLYLKLNKDSLKNKDFCIISDDCWSGFIYKGLGIRYNTPFMWIAIYNKYFNNICANLKDNLNCELKFSHYSDAKPIALLDKNEISLVHYKSFEEGLDKWNKRLQRINYDNLFFKMTSTDREECEKFLNLPVKNKILFTNLDIDNENVVKMDGMTDYYEGFWQYVHSESFKFFDLIKWLNTGKIEKIKNE